MRTELGRIRYTIPRWGVALVICGLMLGAASAPEGMSDSAYAQSSAPELMPSDGQIWVWAAVTTWFGSFNPDFPGIRHAGTWMDAVTAWYLALNMQSFGLEDVRLEEVPIIGWQPTSYGLSVHTPFGILPLDAWPIYYAPFLENGSLTAPLVYVGPGFPENFDGVDVAGKVVVADLVSPVVPPLEYDVLRAEALETYDPDDTFPSGEGHRIWSLVNLGVAYNQAAAGGAAAFIGIHTHKADAYRYFQNAVEIGADPISGTLGPLPGLYVSNQTGFLLRLAAMVPLPSTLVLQGENPMTRTYNVVGSLPGLTQDIIQISGHSDGGAVNDATGASEVLALASYYAARKQQGSSMNKTLQFVITGGHFANSAGLYGFVEAHAEDLLLDTVLNVTVEHIGKHYELINGGLVDSGQHDARGLLLSDTALYPPVSEAVHRHDLRRTFILPPTSHIAVGSGEGYSWHAEGGIPSIWQISPVQYMQSTADTLEKVASGELQRVASTLADFIDHFDQEL